MSLVQLQNSENMIAISLGDFEILKSKTNHENALLYFHGFPGPFEKLPAPELRIADQLYSDITKKHDYYYPLYSIKTNFNFEQTIDDGLKALNFLCNQKSYKSITVVGQSWGAVIALALSRQFNFKNIILITPFLFLPTGSATLQAVQYYSLKYPDLLPSDKISIFAGQLQKIANVNCPKEAFLKTSTPMTVFAADNDEVVAFQKIIDLIAQKKSVKLLVLAGQTHQVENREFFLELVRAELLN